MVGEEGYNITPKSSAIPQEKPPPQEGGGEKAGLLAHKSLGDVDDVAALGTAVCVVCGRIWKD